MKRFFPEFLGAAMAVAGIGTLIAVLWAGATGPVAWIVVGLLIGLGLVVALVGLAVHSATSPSGEAEMLPFDGGAPPQRDGVHRVLAVLDDKCSDEDVAALLLSETAPRTEAHVVAPALSSRLDRLMGDDHAYTAAQERLDATLAALTRHGVTATGHVGSHDPLQAADDGLREFAADEIVFVVGPGEDSDRLQHDLVELAEERYPVPVRRLRPHAQVRS